MLVCNHFYLVLRLKVNNIKNTHSYNNLLTDAQYKNDVKYVISSIKCGEERSKLVVFVCDWK